MRTLISPLRVPALTRRQFAQKALASAAVLSAPAFLRGQNLNGKLNLAVIGSGGRGGASLRALAAENITVLCDVDEKRLDASAAPYPQARKLVDFRKIFDKPSEFDAVVVSTCEHTHAMATLLALRHKKHVYCEKPLTHNVAEARQVREAAATAGRRHADGRADARLGKLPPRRGAHPSRRHRRRDRGARLGLARLGPAEQGRVRRRQGSRLRHRTSAGDAGAGRLALGFVARACGRAAVQRGLRARPEVVSLVGLWQRDDERPRLALERPAVLGAQAEGTHQHRGLRPEAPPRDRSGDDARRP